MKILLTVFVILSLLLSGCLSEVKQKAEETQNESIKTMQSVQNTSNSIANTSESAKKAIDELTTVPTILSVSVETSKFQATIKFDTDIDTTSKVKINTPIGMAMVPQLDILDYGKSHTTTVNMLLPAQTYEYEITVISLKSQKTAQYTGSFKTESPVPNAQEVPRPNFP